MTDPFRRFDDERAALVAAGEAEPLRVMRLKRMAEVLWWSEAVGFNRILYDSASLALATAELTLFLAWERGLGT